MKHAYMVKAIVPNNGSVFGGVLYCEKFTIVAPNASEACSKAISKAKRVTRYYGSRWRVTELVEHAEPL